ncbi:MAG: hypothetical protein C4584_01135 [Armatimonadetes bacterium]|nr:MAG: hypothetical protein C4584_01135 [Armatimonadota bacterium]
MVDTLEQVDVVRQAEDVVKTCSGSSEQGLSVEKNNDPDKLLQAETQRAYSFLETVDRRRQENPIVSLMVFL